MDGRDTGLRWSRLGGVVKERGLKSWGVRRGEGSVGVGNEEKVRNNYKKGGEGEECCERRQ